MKKLQLQQSTAKVLLTSNDLYKENNAFHYQLNICAALLSFYLGTGGYDVGAVTCFLGIPGGHGWERTFHQHSAKIHTTIMSVTDCIIVTAFEDEVIATIKEMLKNKYTSKEILEFVTKYKKKK